MEMYETVYRGSGNMTTLEFDLGTTPHALSAETRFTVSAAGVILDSNSDPDLFDWVTDPNKLAVALGQLDVPEGVHSVEVRSYNPAVSPYFSWGTLLMLFI